MNNIQMTSSKPATTRKKKKKWEVQLIFTGLCAFVMPKSGSGDLKLLLVDATNPKPNERAFGMNEHQPFLAFDMANLVTSTTERLPNRVVPDLSGNDLGYCDLRREILTVSDNNCTQPLDYERGKPPEKPGSGSPLPTSFKWVPGMGDIAAPYELNPDCLTGTHPAVIAVFTFTKGEIRSRRLGRLSKGQRDYAPCEFKINPNANSQLTQTLAEVVEVKMPFEDDTLQLKITSNTYGTLFLEPERKPGPQESYQPLQVVVGNLPFNRKPAPVTRVDHFRWFYELVKSPPDLNKRPIPFVKGGGHVGGSGVFCPNAEFEGP